MHQRPWLVRSCDAVSLVVFLLMMGPRIFLVERLLPFEAHQRSHCKPYASAVAGSVFAKGEARYERWCSMTSNVAPVAMAENMTCPMRATRSGAVLPARTRAWHRPGW